MGVQEYRAELSQLKAENDATINAIRGRLAAYMNGLTPKQKKKNPPKKEEWLIRQFSNRRTLLGRLIRAGGEEYFRQRLTVEKDFKNFGGEFLGMLKTFEQAAAKRGFGVEEQKQRLLDAMVNKTEAWLKNKSNQWREDMQETVLKTQVVELFDRTIDDLKLYAEGNSAMRTAEGTENARLADKTRKELEKYRAVVSGCYMMDTDGNYAVAEKIRKTLEKIRKDLPKMAGGRIVKAALGDLDRLTEDLKEEKNAGRKLGLGKKVKPFVVANEETLLGRTKVDELGAAVFVMERLTLNQDFFDAMDARIQRRVESMAMPHDFNSDETYNALKNKAAECAKEIRRLKGDPKCSKVKLAGYVELLKSCDAQIKEYEAKKLKEVRASVEASKEIARLRKTCESFKEVGKIFTSESGVSYLERAQIMAETQTYDFRNMYEEFVSALLNGDKETLLEIRAKLQAMVEEFNTRRGREILDDVDEAELAAESLDIDGDNEYADVMIDEDELGDLLSAYGEEEPAAETPVKEEPVRVKEGAGAAATVNADAYSGDDISKRIQGIFDDLKDI